MRQNSTLTQLDNHLPLPCYSDEGLIGTVVNQIPGKLEIMSEVP